MRRVLYIMLIFMMVSIAPVMAQTADSLLLSDAVIPINGSGYVNVSLLNTQFSVAGFAVRIVLQDSTYTSFLSAARGTNTANFEYFNVRISAGTCKIVSLANMPGGNNTPPMPMGLNQIVRLQVYVDSLAPLGAVDSLVFMNDTIPPDRDNSISDSTGYNNSVPFMRGSRVQFTYPNSVDEPSDLLPERFTLHQNYPNPFNAETSIKFDLAENENNVVLSIYNLLGHEVQRFEWPHISPGEHTVIWDGRNSYNEPVSSGVYFYRLNLSEFTGPAQKMTLLK